ncbi:MAG: hypothetical protein ACRYG8_38425, partial [Janthinobacterium lividum]
MRRVQLSLLVVAAAALGLLPFLRHARNRLLSGQSIDTYVAFGLSSPIWTLGLGLGLGLLVLPLVWPTTLTRWTSLLGAGIALAAAAAIGADAAAHLAASGSPAARTSLGSGAWLFAAT